VKYQSTDSGFTLLELLVVLALIGLVLVLVPPFLDSSSTRREIRSAAFVTASLLREIRADAIAGNRPAAFEIDVRRRVMSGDRSGRHPIPQGVEVILHTAAEERVSQSRGKIRFFPDGTSTGGGLEMIGAGVAYYVLVDWLTGRIGVEERSGAASAR